jgi:DNA modification methylase
VTDSAPSSLDRYWPGPLEVVRDQHDVDALPHDAVLNRVVLGDAVSAMGKLDPGIADCVFFDPPYYLQLSGRRLRRWGVQTAVDGVSESWDKFSSFAGYDEFIERALRAIKRLMKPDATIWAIGTYHNVFRIGRLMQDLGFWMLNDVTWVKTNPMPNWLGVRFTNATETLIWATKSKDARSYTFNRAAAKRYGAGKVGAGIWVLPVCAGRERVRGADGKRAHATQKPAELLRRVIATSTLPGDLVLDPTAGVGTTGYVARAMDRDFIMIERDEAYVETMRRRFDGAGYMPPERIAEPSRVAQYFKIRPGGQ